MMKTSLLKSSLVAAFALLCVGAGAQNSSAFKSANLKMHSRVQPAKVVKNKLVTPFVNSRQMIQKAKPTTSYYLPDICPSFYDWVMGTGDGKANWTSINGVINHAAALADSDAEFMDSDILLAPKDSMLTYFNGTIGATSFRWSIPGGDPATAQSQDADVVYTAEGRYAFPTVTGANADGDSTYQAFGKIEIDKLAEISHTSSIAPLIDGAALTYGIKDAVEGHLTGSNTVGFEKYGSIFSVGKANSTLEAVNLYIVKNPKGANANSKVDVVVYAIGMTEAGDIVLDGIELGRKSVKISDMMADARNVTGFQSQAGGAFLGMAEFKFDTPILLEEPIFFVTVENFGNDVAGGDDFAIMFDLTGEAPSEDNFYQYNSFMFTELKYNDGTIVKDWYPLAWAFNFGEEYKNMDLFICPVVNYGAPGGVESSSVSAQNRAYVADGAIVLNANGAKSADIYNVMGQLVYTTAIAAEGVYNVPSDNLANGIYVVKFVNENGSVETVKVRK